MSNPTHLSPSAPVRSHVMLVDDGTPPEGRIVSTHRFRASAAFGIRDVARGYMVAVEGTHLEDGADDSVSVMRADECVATFSVVTR